MTIEETKTAMREKAESYQYGATFGMEILEDLQSLADDYSKRQQFMCAETVKAARAWIHTLLAESVTKGIKQEH